MECGLSPPKRALRQNRTLICKLWLWRTSWSTLATAAETSSTRRSTAAGALSPPPPVTQAPPPQPAYNPYQPAAGYPQPYIHKQLRPAADALFFFVCHFFLFVQATIFSFLREQPLNEEKNSGNCPSCRGRPYQANNGQKNSSKFEKNAILIQSSPTIQPCSLTSKLSYKRASVNHVLVVCCRTICLVLGAR